MRRTEEGVMRIKILLGSEKPKRKAGVLGKSLAENVVSFMDGFILCGVTACGVFTALFLGVCSYLVGHVLSGLFQLAGGPSLLPKKSITFGGEREREERFLKVHTP